MLSRGVTLRVDMHELIDIASEMPKYITTGMQDANTKRLFVTNGFLKLCSDHTRSGRHCESTHVLPVKSSMRIRNTLIRPHLQSLYASRETELTKR